MKAQWEDGTTGRPLGDDEDLHVAGRADEPEPPDLWDEMSPAQQAVATLGGLR